MQCLVKTQYSEQFTRVCPLCPHAKTGHSGQGHSGQISHFFDIAVEQNKPFWISREKYSPYYKRFLRYFTKFMQLLRYRSNTSDIVDAWIKLRSKIWPLKWVLAQKNCTFRFKTICIEPAHFVLFIWWRFDVAGRGLSHAPTMKTK